MSFHPIIPFCCTFSDSESVKYAKIWLRHCCSPTSPRPEWGVGRGAGSGLGAALFWGVACAEVVAMRLVMWWCVNHGVPYGRWAARAPVCSLQLGIALRPATLLEHAAVGTRALRLTEATRCDVERLAVFSYQAKPDHHLVMGSAFSPSSCSWAP